MYRPLGASRSGWMDNIEMYIREMGCENAVWSHVAKFGDKVRAVWNTVVKRRVS